MKPHDAITNRNQAAARRGEVWRVAVVYEDEDARDRAKVMCNRLAREFWRDIRFEFSWWLFDDLEDSANAEHASKEASQADIIFFSMQAHSQFPDEVQEWVEDWVSKRKNPIGVLAGLIGIEARHSEGVTPAQVYLKNVARRAGMDFLPLMEHSTSSSVHDSPEMIEHRSHDVTPMMEEILHNPAAQPRWGINE